MSKFPRTWLALSITTALWVTNAQAETSVQENSPEDQGSVANVDLSGSQTDNSTVEQNAEPAAELTALLSAAKEQTFDLTEQCLPPANAEQENALPTRVEADSLDGINGKEATYSGNVQVTQGTKRVNADSVTLYQAENTIVAKGNVEMTNGQIKTTSETATTNLDTDVTTLEMANYHLLCQTGRGDAKVIRAEGKLFYELKDGTITSCPEDDDSWRLVSSSIEIDQEAEEATLYNPRFEIQKVPVFYLPWLTVPISDARKTGFLYPTVAYGTSDGFELDVPIYWNLAPNYDLETTFKYMSERGLQTDGTFRYLNDWGRGQIEAQYLADDQKYPDLGDRWGIGYSHYGVFDRNWKVEVDYAKVSDIEYFSDISSNIGEREDGQLLQQGKVSYRNEHWDTSLLVRDFQLLSDTDNLPYRMLPQLSAHYFYPQLMNNVNFDVISHATHFTTDDERNRKPTQATRVHIEPGVTIPLTTTWGSWESEGRLLGTYYHQDLNDVDMSHEDTKNLESDVTRFIPEFRSTGTLFLERDTTFIDGYTQTLEPKVQYLYVPYEDQSNIYNYDTSLLQLDYYGLFRTRKYGGVDKIAAANQVSYGATTRFYDSSYKERMNVSFGQIYYLQNSNTNTGDPADSNYSAWAVESDFNFNDYLFYHGGIQYDIGDEEIQLADSALEYRRGPGYIQTNYRYVTRSYLDKTVGNSIHLDHITTDGISQVGVLGGYKINKNWSVNGQYFYDTTENMPLESLARVTYTSDCWYVGITYTDQLRSWTRTQTPDPGPEYEENISFNIGIIGFGTNFGTDFGDGGNALGYGRPFYLNN
ncbi:LPS assembly protein LptD [Vibrio sp. UCD-FRSSP16_10]|uniref:LPS assembly protein LptD n=1 Tax=unclassified Vibrio TaxID=2614977 RepID=UPI000801C064|nr:MULTISPECIES: LPS assembly protein LptD [unclassified Vibrio]OBT16773.1 LPS assembly protein LptD [Vibrio sp. UCD-FRSSP16_30]OBT21400.1 LPS assembly protein LptD [Vibrio sp. UCD-FRSSP16_10]